MTLYNVSDTELGALKDKVILIIGGCSGIGQAAVEVAHRMSFLVYKNKVSNAIVVGNGANVIMGDWNEQEGEEITKRLKEYDTEKKHYFQQHR
jgi:NADPH:quinone reductase-like Zn-dependent oxidoreductase